MQGIPPTSQVTFGQILEDLPTLTDIQSRFGFPPTVLLKRRLVARKSAAEIAEEFQCQVEQVQRWILIIQPTVAVETKRIATARVASEPPLHGRKPGQLMTLLQGRLGKREQALQKAQDAGSLAELYRTFNLPVSYATFYDAMCRSYGKDFAALVRSTRVPKAPREKVVKPPKVNEKVEQLRVLIGNREAAVTRLNAAGSVSALMKELNLGWSYFVFCSAFKKLYGSDIASTIVRPEKASHTARKLTSDRVAELLGSREQAIAQLEDAGSAAALLRKLSLGITPMTFSTALKALYGNDILKSITRGTHPGPQKPKVRTTGPLISKGMGRGVVVTAIVQAFTVTHDWPETANRLRIPLTKLREVVRSGMTDFTGQISSDDLRELLQIERPVMPPIRQIPAPDDDESDPGPILLPGQFSHPCGLTLSKDVQSELQRYLDNLNLSETEFFTGYYDSDTGLEVAEEVGTSVEVLDQIAEYYKRQQDQPAEVIEM